MEDFRTGYKATDKNMCCNGYQFKLGKWHKHEGEIKLCESGFHFCEYPSGPWSYYTDSDDRLFKVEAKNVIVSSGPGADLKHVAQEIRLVEEIMPAGNRNTGNWNTGDWNTGNRNTGNWNTGYRNTGNRNTGNWNTGYRNTGDRNTGDWNTGYRNTGDWNTGDWNTGNRNTGYGNVGVYHSGMFNSGEAPFSMFNLPANRKNIDMDLVYQLSEALSKDDDIDPEPYLTLPNATSKRIKELHDAHKNARKKR
jgi:hypothetical protein